MEPREYLDVNKVPALVDDLVGRLVSEQPADPRSLLACILLDGGDPGLIELTCAVQHYAWGMKGSSSEVAQLTAGTGASIDQDKPYAELWMGTHPSGPSMAGSVKLRDWIEQHKEEALGRRVAGRWGDLPFLFKVLSVNTALSIQAHPDKPNAERLHARDPKNYKDDNHKPEMAIALTPFEAMCSFVSPGELTEVFASFPELAGVVGADRVRAYNDAAAAGDADARKAALRNAFGALFQADSGSVATAVRSLIERLKGCGRKLTEKEDLLVRLEGQYPDDVGVLSALFLNRVTLQPGDAIYLPANEPHAYVRGNIVECMAASDNVVRAGLTPKFIDKETLVSMLTYSQGLPPVLKGDPVDEMTRRYVPPFDEFEVHGTEVPAGQTYMVAPAAGPSIAVVLDGSGTLSAGGKQVAAARGKVLFIRAGVGVRACAGSTPIKLSRATVNAQVFGSKM